MANLNKVMLIGTLTRDPEIKYLPKGTAVAQIGLAINHNYKTADGDKREEVTFLDCEAFGKTAELMGEYLKKGKNVYLEGRLKLDTWDDKQSGQKRSKLKVVVEGMQFLGGKEGGDGGQRQQQKPSAPAKRPQPQQADHDLDPVDDGSSIPF